MKRILVVVVLGLFSNATLAWDNCKYEREIERVVNIESAELLEVEAGAGSLEIKGSDRTDIAIKATLCSEDEDALAKMDVSSAVKSGVVHIETELPNKSWMGSYNTQMSINLILTVPSSLRLDVEDSSGEASVKNVASLNMKDSSGELMIKDIAGDVSVVDSSGELNIKNIGGNVDVTDSSGDMYAKNIGGDFVVDADSSGEIDIEQVGRNVLIKRDSSGAIKVEDVTGDFTVKADGSGGIEHDNVGGTVSLPR